MRSSVLLSVVAYLALMNYYCPLHQALVNKSQNTHIYWYVTFILILTATVLTSYLALTDVDNTLATSMWGGLECPDE